MTIKRKDRPEEPVVLMFDWAEGYIELPRMDRMSIEASAMLEESESTADVLHALGRGLPESTFDFIMTLNAEEFNEFLQAWTQRTIELSQLDEQPEESEATVASITSDRPTDAVLRMAAREQATVDKLGLTAQQLGQLNAAEQFFRECSDEGLTEFSDIVAEKILEAGAQLHTKEAADAIAEGLILSLTRDE